MNFLRFKTITDKYRKLRIAVVGDFCLDRYLEIDPSKQEISIETNLPVHNVVRVRSQPGGAGTILNNLVALGIGNIFPIGFCGTDGEGFELRHVLELKKHVRIDYFAATDQRCTFTYCKPLLLEKGKPPVELNRLDTKNWTRTPAVVEGKIVEAIDAVAKVVDAFIVLDQVDIPDTGVITPRVLDAFGAWIKRRPGMLVMGDSRRHLRRFPAMTLKMNRAELAHLAGTDSAPSLKDVTGVAAELARKNNRAVFVTLSESGICGASPGGTVEHVGAVKVRGEIDIVGAGDAVTANLAAALAAGATLREALEMANAAASIVIHQLGTTGTASVPQIRELLET